MPSTHPNQVSQLKPPVVQWSTTRAQMPMTPTTGPTAPTGLSLGSSPLSAPLLRLLFISSLFLVNFLCLVNMTFNHRLKQCVHTTTCAFVVVSTTAYLSSWLPYLFHCYYNSTVWPVLDVRDHCIIQHTVSGQIMTILFAMLCVRKLYDAFSPAKARVLSYAVCIAWTVPQLVYMTMAEVTNSDHNSFYFLDRVQSTNSTLHPSDFKVVTQGLILCVHKLSGVVFAQMSWYYVVLVIPMTILLVVCLSISYIKQPVRTNDIAVIADTPLTPTVKDNRCKCSTDIILNACLYLNFLWLLIIRPLVMVNSLVNNNDNPLPEWPQSEWSSVQSVYLDMGSHLILVIIAILVPFSSQSLFRTYIATFKKTIVSHQ